MPNSRANYRKNYHFYESSVDVESHIAVTLHRLTTRNTLSTIADLYGIGESTASVIVQECCGAIKYHLKPLTI
jgi:hypothetical protein